MVIHVDVPRASVSLFSECEGAGLPPRAPLAAVAEALGFPSSQKLIATVTQWCTSWRFASSLSAAEFVALLQVLQFRSARAGVLLRDLTLGGVTRTVSLPTEPLPNFLDEGGSNAAGDKGSSPPKAKAGSPQKPVKASQQTPAEALEPPWPTCDPEDVGMEREPLERCRGYLHYRIKRKHFAGIVGGVVKNGKLVYFDEAGYADIEGKVPMRQDTLMRLFSMTKCIVNVAFLTYAEDPALGIDLEDPVWKYIPSFKTLKLAPKRGSEKPRELDKASFEEKTADGKAKKEKLPVGPTLRQLLTHTAGLGYGPTLGDNLPPKSTDHYKIYYDLIERANRGQITSLAEWVDELAKVPLKVRPGSYWEYSFATDVLGRVIEVISGKPLDKAVEERVCGPLGMVDSCFQVPAHKAHRMGAWYEKKDPVDEKGNHYEKVPPGATYVLNMIDKPGADSGWCGNNCSKILSAGGTIEVPLSIRGGMVSTFRDYLRFLMMIRNMGELDGVRILRRDTMQVMLCNQIPAATGRRAAWVFDKKGQGFNFLGQIQVQHYGKETFQEKGELKKGNQTYASLAPGTVSAEFGWGGLGGPAWTIDPRADLIVLSMTQTALELDHEENLRFSARRAIHAGIFGLTAGPAKVTDFPPEGHEGLKSRKLRSTLEGPGGVEGRRGADDGRAAVDNEATFMEAEEHARANRKSSLKEMAVAKGNVGHEVHEEEDVDPQAQPPVGPGSPPGAGDAPGGASGSRDNRSPSQSGEEGNASPGGQEQKAQLVEVATTPKKRELQRNSTTGSDGNSQKRQATGSGVLCDTSAKTPATKEDGLLFSRVRVKNAEEDGFQKARVTSVDDKGKVEVVTEGTYETMNLSIGDVSTIDESHMGASRSAEVGPKDFGFVVGVLKGQKRK